MRRIAIVALALSLSACTEINITAPVATPAKTDSVSVVQQTILSGPADPVMAVYPGQYFHNSVTLIVPVGQTPNVSFHTSGLTITSAEDLIDYGPIGCISLCTTHTWKWTIYFLAPPTEGDYYGTFTLDGTKQESNFVAKVSWKG